MIKSIIKRICYKLYSIGKYEDLRIKDIERRNFLNSNAAIGEQTIISVEANIYNYQGIKSKIRIGSHSSIMGELCVFKHGGELEIGNYCFVGPRTRIQSAKKIYIGNNVLIAHDVNIIDNISHPLNSKERHLDFVRFLKHGLAEKIDLREEEIIIQNDVWIGFGSTILKGVTIGQGAIIGANTLISEDVPPFAVMVGNPARIIKYTD